jgi:hypothetical protein
MGRLRDFGLDLACYFGHGEGSERTREAAHEEESWLPTALWVLAPPAVTFVLHGPLGLEEDFAGRLTTVGVVAVVAMACGLALRVAGRRMEPDEGERYR